MAVSWRKLLWAFLVCLTTVLLGTLYRTPLFAIAFPIGVVYVFRGRVLGGAPTRAPASAELCHT